MPEKSEKTKKRIEHKFDTYLKKVARNAKKDFLKLQSSRYENEISLDSFPYESEQFSVTDEYFADENLFVVEGLEIPTGSESMTNFVSILSEKQRNIILLYYVAEFTEEDIAQKLSISRREVSYQKDLAHYEIFKFICKGEKNEKQ